MKFCSFLLAGRLNLTSMGLIGNRGKDMIIMATMCNEKKNAQMQLSQKIIISTARVTCLTNKEA